MNPESAPLSRLRTLILKSQSEPLSDPEIAQLNELMRIDGAPEEAAALVDQLSTFNDSGSLDSLPLAKLLSEAFGNEDATDASSTEPHLRSRTPANRSYSSNHPDAIPHSHHRASSPVQHSRRATTYWLIGLAASHLLIASLAWSVANLSSTNTITAGITLEATPPQLVSMTACVWRDSVGSELKIGQPIRTGEMLDLAEGVAELSVGEGTPGEALVRIEGPASVLIHANGRVELLRGAMTAKSLGTGSEQFVIDTPAGEVLLDGQSSVGLMSRENLDDEVHLFAGRALVRASHASSTNHELRLEEGEAVRFLANSGEGLGAVMFEASLSSFVSARSSGFDPLNLGQDYVDAVLDSNPCIYWRFEELSSQHPFHVTNLGSYPDMNAELIGEPGWRRYGENRVAELGKIGTSSGFRSTRVWPPKPLSEYTIEMWVKPELYHHGEILCMHEVRQKKDGRYSHGMMLESLAQHWHTALQNLQPNRFRFVHRTPASGAVLEGSNMVADQPYQVRTWQHLVATKQGDRVSLWLDGRMAAEQSDLGLLEKDLHIVIGQLYTTRNERRFVGQIDEVAVYDRCLSAEELQSHIEAAGRFVSSEQ